MKRLFLSINILTLWLAPTSAYAAETSKVYSSGILVLIFIGFCAALIVAQLIPAILLLMGTIKGFLRKSKEEPIEAVIDK